MLNKREEHDFGELAVDFDLGLNLSFPLSGTSI